MKLDTKKCEFNNAKKIIEKSKIAEYINDNCDEFESFDSDMSCNTCGVINKQNEYEYNIVTLYYVESIWNYSDTKLFKNKHEARKEYDRFDDDYDIYKLTIKICPQCVTWSIDCKKV